MRKIIFSSMMLFAASLGIQAQEPPTMATLFKEVPDSLFPYLTKNNRLDMVDFMEAKMKAEVTNLLDGKSEMLVLTDDSLSLKMNAILRIDMKRISLEQPVDSSSIGIQVTRTYILNENQAERVVDYYSAAWRKLSSGVGQSTLLKRDEKLLTKPYL